jgi:hypothetical protein
VSAAVAGFSERADPLGGSQLEGGMVSSSRGVLFGEGPVPASRSEWLSAFSERLALACGEVSHAVLLPPRLAL